MNETLSLFDLGAPDWSGTWEAREVSFETTDAWIARYHYLGKSPAGAAYRMGVFGPELVGVVVYAQATNAHGVAMKFGLEAWRGNIEIARVAVHPDAPANTTSRVIALANAQLRSVTGLDWLFSYADTGQGHHGGIYQALGAVYVGMSEARHGFLLNGVPIHPRSVVAKYGTQNVKGSPTCMELAAARGDQLEYVENLNTAKHLYIIPIGTKATQRAIRKALAEYQTQYPKRDAAVAFVENVENVTSREPLDLVIEDYVARGVWPYR